MNSNRYLNCSSKEEYFLLPKGYLIVESLKDGYMKKVKKMPISLRSTTSGSEGGRLYTPSTSVYITSRITSGSSSGTEFNIHE